MGYWTEKRPLLEFTEEDAGVWAKIVSLGALTVWFPPAGAAVTAGYLGFKGLRSVVRAGRKAREKKSAEKRAREEREFQLEMERIKHQPTPKPSRQELFGEMLRKYEESKRLIDALPLQDDEKEAILEDMRQALLYRASEMLKR